MPLSKTKILIIAFLMTPVLPCLAAGLEDADKRLFQVQKTMAEKDDPRAKYYLGEMHEHGLGTKQDVNEAFKWYAKAAELGDPMAKRKMDMRQEIMNEYKKEQELERRQAAPPPAPAKPATPVTPPSTAKPAAPPAPVKPAAAAKSSAAPKAVAKPEPTSVPDKNEAPAEKIAVVEKDDRQVDDSRTKAAAEREKRRAQVRKILLERMRNPVGGLFE